ncbi:imidazolonepropionase [Anaeromyxobacter sp. Fw109-5]|uniref:imidazolonepropionase n=1 Tax=Anaeromyxobacter sp. (strain Fw109-5) TaxID=404589 RepID=UPI0000ED75C2|nr:imidazolonepropionase [Anaeromyxobacter sp. Fw109-5]ABS26518.1 imidazolonepropionase [Anaeromyxobacter sp. Fw109-5]
MPARKPLRPTATLVLRNAVVATCDAGTSDPGLIPSAAVAVDDRRIAYAGPERGLEEVVDAADAQVIDAGGGLVTPGLVDAHTHLVFAGERAGEFALRCAGKSYLSVALSGGGIAVTTRATRAASDATLLEAAIARARRLLAQGVTTIEVKSGYGLSTADELRLLRVIHDLAHALWAEVTIVPTLLAHAVPPERGGDRDAFVRELCEVLIPQAARERLADHVDAFAEEGAFTIDEARRILAAGERHGLVPHLHADQLTASGGAQLAAALSCASADHLEEIDDEGIAALARADVVAGLLPLSTLFLGSNRYAPARKLLSAGARIALATNLNPGSAMSENVGLALSLACLKLRLSPAEALVAFTAGGARALRRADAGRLRPGADADLVLWGCSSPEHLAWHMAVNHALVVVKRGRVVHTAAPGAAVDCR